MYFIFRFNEGEHNGRWKRQACSTPQAPRTHAQNSCRRNGVCDFASRSSPGAGRCAHPEVLRDVGAARAGERLSHSAVRTRVRTAVLF